MSARLSELWKKLAGFRYALLVAAVGLVLLLWPGGATDAEDTGAPSPEEQRIEALITRIEGVGQARVLLSEGGAVVVCEGAERSSVRLAVTQAVRCYTGLGANEVTIFHMDDSWR